MTSTQARGPLRVAQIIHGAGVGGTERHIRSLLERLPEHGITPILIASEEGTLLEFARSRGIETHVAPRTSAWSYLRALRRLLETMRPDIAHAHSGRLPCIAARLARIPRIVETRHGALIGLGPVRQWPAIGLVEGWKCRMAHQTITVCASDRRWLITRGGLDPSRVLSILNGISVDHGDTSLSRPDASQTQDRMRALGRGSRSTPNGSVGANERQELMRKAREELGLPTEGRWIGFVGRLTAQKAPERMIDLLTALRRSDPQWRALIVGDGPKLESLKERARLNGIEDAVVWKGSDPRGELAMRAVDCVCLPSISEGLPYVLLEALAAGRPIVATPVGGVPEVLDGPVLERGCLPWNAPGWAARVEMLTDPVSSQEWSDAAYARILALDEGDMIGALASVYRGASYVAAHGRYPSVANTSSS